jgi:carbamoylphosphate synthase large subunit
MRNAAIAVLREIGVDTGGRTSSSRSIRRTVGSSSSK